MSYGLLNDGESTVVCAHMLSFAFYHSIILCHWKNTALSLETVVMYVGYSLHV